MAYNTVLQQGRFTSDGSNRRLAIRSDVDWMVVRNYTTIGTNQNPGEGYQFEWFRGFAAGDGLIVSNTNGAATLEMDKLGAGGGGFTLINDRTDPLLSAAVATTAATDATQPVVSTGSTAGLAVGSVVRLSSVANATSLNAIDFEIDNIVASTSFRIRYAMANAPGIAGGAGNYRIVNRDPMYYPQRRFVANISQAAQAVVTCTVSHGFTVGQAVRLVVPQNNAGTMVEIDGLQGNIVAVTASTITLDIDSSAFTAFTFPVPGDYPFTPPQVIPIGEDTETALVNSANILDDATDNVSILGIELGGGANGPAGENNDVVYWLAGKSFSVDNQ